MMAKLLDRALAYLGGYVEVELVDSETGDPVETEVKVTYDSESAMFTASLLYVYANFPPVEQFWWSAPTLAAALVGLVDEIKKENAE